MILKLLRVITNKSFTCCAVLEMIYVPVEKEYCFEVDTPDKARLRILEKELVQGRHTKHLKKC